MLIPSEPRGLASFVVSEAFTQSAAAREPTQTANAEATIEVQHYDGTVGEYDLEAWNEMLLVDAEPPEDWSGSLDIDREDYGVDRDERAADRYGNPLDELLDS